MSQLLAQLQRSGAVEPNQLEAALRRQQIYGGSLDTIMLELELVSPHRLRDELALATGLPVASDAWIDRRDDRPWARLPSELVELGWVVALGVEDGRPVVAVHPELPDDELARLKRMLPSAIVMVTPECCLATVAAERTGSVMPQRYAVLAAAYLAEHRSARVRKPAAAASASPPPAPKGPAPAPWLAVSPAPQERPLVAVATAHLATASAASSTPERPSLGGLEAGTMQQPPPRASTTTTQTGPLPSARSLQSSSAATGGAESRFAEAAQAPRRPALAAETPSLTALSPQEREADLAARVAPLQQALLRASQRDEITDLLLKCAAQLAPRVALFGVKKEGLKGLAGLHTLHEITEEIVEPGAALEEALAGQGRVEEVRDLGLRMAVRQGAAVPCIFQPIRVRDRAVLVLYLDRDGARFDPFERVFAATLAAAAGDQLEQVLRRLRGEPAVSKNGSPSPAAELEAPPVSIVQPPPPPAPTLTPPPASPAAAPPAPANPPPASIRLSTTLTGAVPPTQAAQVTVGVRDQLVGQRPLFAPPPRPGQGTSGADGRLPAKSDTTPPKNPPKTPPKNPPKNPVFAAPAADAATIPTTNSVAPVPPRAVADAPSVDALTAAPLGATDLVARGPLGGGRGTLIGSGVPAPSGSSLEVAPLESVRRLPTDLSAGPSVVGTQPAGQLDAGASTSQTSNPPMFRPPNSWGAGPVPLDAPPPIDLSRPVVAPPSDRASAAPPTTGPIAALLAMPRLVSTSPGPAADPSYASNPAARRSSGAETSTSAVRPAQEADIAEPPPPPRSPRFRDWSPTHHPSARPHWSTPVCRSLESGPWMTRSVKAKDLSTSLGKSGRLRCAVFVPL